MTTAIAKALQGLAFESGEVVEDGPAEFHEALGDLLVSEAQVVREPTITDQVADATKASDVTEQLDELAVRADEVAAIENPVVAQVAVESLHREFKTIMRANQLPFDASSFESSYSVEGQAKGIGADARRVAGYSRAVGEELRGFSAEAGTIVQTIRRDQARLVDAQAVLAKAIPAVQRISGQLKEHPVVIDHQGIGLFMTVGGAPAINFKAAIDTETAQLRKLHDAIVQAIAAVQEGAHAFAANPTAPITQLLPESKFAALNAFADKHHFMGNHTIVAHASKASPVRNFKRVSEHKLQGWNLTKSIGWAVMATLGWTIASGLLISIGGMVTGGLVPVIAASAVGAKVVRYGRAAGGIYSGIKNYQNNANHSEVKSAAGAGDFVHALTELSTIGRMTDIKFGEDAAFSSLDVTHKAGAPNATYGAFEDTIGNIATAIDCLYEQALYDVVEGSKMAAQVTKHF